MPTDQVRGKLVKPGMTASRGPAPLIPRSARALAHLSALAVLLRLLRDLCVLCVRRF